MKIPLKTDRISEYIPKGKNQVDQKLRLKVENDDQFPKNYF